MKTINDIRYQAQKLRNELVRIEMKEKKPFNLKRYSRIAEICERYNYNCVEYLKKTEKWESTIYGKLDIPVERKIYMIVK